MRKLHGAALAAILALGPAAAMMPAPTQAQVAIGISVGAPPPPLPIYAQPPIPGPGYMWTPGYWGWDGGYYWIPGTWVLAPEPGFLWTPAWWGWDGVAFVFHTGYWGPFVGFYGGVDYGFGYPGFGYAGGYWRHDRFFYNRAVNNLGGGRFANTYNRPVGGARLSRVSYNGGAGGTTARPTGAQMAAMHQFRRGATAAQVNHEHAAAASPMLRAAANHGDPPVAATRQAAVLRGPGVTAGAHALTRANLTRGGRTFGGGEARGAMGRGGSRPASSHLASSRPASMHSAASVGRSMALSSHGAAAHRPGGAYAFNGRESARSGFAAARPERGPAETARVGGGRSAGAHFAAPARGSGGGGGSRPRGGGHGGGGGRG